MTGRACIVVTLASMANACTEPARPTATPVHAEPAAIAPIAAAPSKFATATPPPDATLPSFAAWTDEIAIDTLLRGADLPAGDKDPRSCGFGLPQQSCVPGPEAVDWACREDCAGECNRCAPACGAAMTTCRAACARGDAACERTCGREAGKCLQTCLGARDRCDGECVKRVAAYVEEVRTNYGCKDKRSALDICKRAVACMSACTDDACRAACKRSLAAGCNEHFLQSLDLESCMAYESPI